MGGHTPGPWEAEPITRFSAPNERPWVGRLKENRYSALSCGDTQEEAISNSRLIAAAPDLLEALTAICEALRDGDDFDASQIAAAAGYAAIAKATGTTAPPSPAPHT